MTNAADKVKFVNIAPQESVNVELGGGRALRFRSDGRLRAVGSPQKVVVLGTPEEQTETVALRISAIARVKGLRH